MPQDREAGPLCLVEVKRAGPLEGELGGVPHPPEYTLERRQGLRGDEGGEVEHVLARGELRIICKYFHFYYCTLFSVSYNIECIF